MKTKKISFDTNFDVNKLSHIDKKAFDIMTPVSTKEWYDSVYTFNKNKTKHLPNWDNYIIKYIKEYFNLLDVFRDKNVKFIYKSKRKRKSLGNKFWLGKTEIKHTNDNIIINLYTFNNKNNYINPKLEKTLLTLYNIKLDKLKIYKRNSKTLFKQIIIFYRKKISKIFNILKERNIKLLEVNSVINNFNKYLLNNIYTKFVQKVLKKEILILYYKQYVLYNNFKSMNTYITPLSKLIHKVYNKKVVFNIVNLKSYFLDTNIFTQIIATKAKNRNNRVSNILVLALSKINPPIIRKNLIGKEKIVLDTPVNLPIKSSKKLNNMYITYNSKNKDKEIIKSLENINISGIRLEASGRLTKRFTAQRSVYNVKYKGTLKNINSAYKGISTKYIRNNTTSNIQYSYKGANNRIGAFGFKGWISSL
jgi:hypothetical protein